MTRALLIIDVQKGMFSHGEPHKGREVVEKLAGMLSQARAHGMPVFFVQHDGGEGSPLARDGEGFHFVDELAPRGDEDVTIKRQCSAFHGTDLINKLRAANIDELIIGGMQTEFCVDTAVRGAFERGLAVTLIEDGHTTFDTTALPATQIIAHHNHTLASGHFAEVVEAAELGFGF
ncbi:cysteine hydrolase family protein [uncultured Erythrobacter sp.]|uniref:cysteine hydrolase family protein n=1 Tax=uncultured Erythrobacter sp. TaxID=263913 RepID=UPI00260F6109|nr:cysteine hydrolase family protein [uncultured Erythrobacter sp.]